LPLRGTATCRRGMGGKRVARDPSGGLTSSGGVARWASGGEEQSSAAALGVRGARGEEVKRGEQG
jgi:hypothetical protein